MQQRGAGDRLPAFITRTAGRFAAASLPRRRIALLKPVIRGWNAATASTAQSAMTTMTLVTTMTIS